MNASMVLWANIIVSVEKDLEYDLTDGHVNVGFVY